MSVVRGSILLIALCLLTGCLAGIPKGYKPVSNEKNESFYVNHDEFKGTSFIRHKFFFSDDKPIEIYQVKDNFLRVVFTYRGSDWIFFRTATIINSAGEKMSFAFESHKKTTEVLSGGNVFETVDIVLSDSEAKKLLAILNDSGEKKVRLSGKYYKDYTLYDKKVLALRDVIENYYKQEQ